jgi:CHASE2 domain-containing sensor protein
MGTAHAMDAGRRHGGAERGSNTRSREIIYDIIADVCLIAILVLAAIGVEHTRVGNALLLAAYEWQQGSFHSGGESIKIVDISLIQSVCSKATGSTRTVTPRDTLLEVLQAVADDDPAAIAIDINFSPDDNGEYMSPEDPAFLEACARLTSHPKNKHIPVFVGVNTEPKRRSAKLLQDARVAPLAACIGIKDDTRTLPLVVEEEGFTTKSLCARLADVKKSGVSDGTSRRWPSWLAVSQFEDVEGDARAEVFLVDYSSLDALEKRDVTLPSINPVVIRDAYRGRSSFFRDKLVLVGIAQLGVATDTFNVLTRIGKPPVPGIYIHACGVNTLLTGRLAELTPIGRALVDALMSLTALAPVALIRWLFRHRNVAERRLKWLSYLIMAGAVYVAAGWVCYYMRLLWVDYYVVIITLVAHPFIEPQLRGSYAFIGDASRFVTFRKGRRTV